MIGNSQSQSGTILLICLTRNLFKSLKRKLDLFRIHSNPGVDYPKLNQLPCMIVR